MTMLKDGRLGSHDDVLESIANAIDIPEHLFDAAVERYEAMGRWLERNGSTIKAYRPEISLQGSFLLGTVTRPIGDDENFDLDLVCTLSATKFDFTMASLKRDVGVELRSYAKANNMQHEPEDKQRCWTLEYADSANFHMDILPALPDVAAYRKLLEQGGYRELAADVAVRERAIAITDNTLANYNEISPDWPLSNPKGYAVWFKARQLEEVRRLKEAVLAEGTKYKSVDDIPDSKVKTPLQRTVQLLKRHRDSMFADDPEHKPISIIITTLAAHAYSGEQSLSQALRTILLDMDDYIQMRGETAWVANPVNPEENFADKWSEEPKKQENFFAWLKAAKHDFGLYVAGHEYRNIPDSLTEAMTTKTIESAMPALAVATAAIISKPDAAVAEAQAIAEQSMATKPWSH